MATALKTDELPAAPAPSSDVEVGKRNLDQYGYTVHEDLIMPEQVAILRDRLLEQAEMEQAQGVATFRMTNETGLGKREIGTPPDGREPAWQAVLALPNKGRPFIDLAMHPVVRDYGRHLLDGTPFYMAQATGLIVRRGSGGQVLHTDQIPIPFSTPLPVYFHAMVALSDFEADMGATQLVPATHRGRAPRFRLDEASGQVVTEEQVESVPATCRAGSALIFESRLWHYQGRSTSDKTRLSVLNGYCMHFIRPQDDYVASLHDDVYEGLSEAERAMLGFEVVQEYTGRIYPRFRGDRRYNTNARYPFIPELRRDGTGRAEPFEGMGSGEH